MIMKTYTIFILAGCTLAASLNAQTAKKTQTANKDTLIQRNLVLEKEYQPTVEPAEKMMVSPEIETRSIEKQPLAFSIAESPTTIHGDYNPLPAAGIRIDYPASEQFGYLRLGVGSHRSFIGDAQFNLIRESKQTLDLSYQHRSVFGDITNSADEIKRSYFNKNHFAANYKLHLENTIIDASLSEKYNAWNYYGTWRTDTLPTNSFYIPGGQWSSDSKFRFGLKTKDLGQPFSYEITAEGHIFRLGRGITLNSDPNNEKGGREKEFSAKAALNYDLSDIFHLGLDAKMRNFTYRSPVSWPLDVSLYEDNQIDKTFTDRRWFEFNPYAKMTYKKWMLSAGLKLAIPTLESERVKANITAGASTAIGDKMIFNAKLDGGVQPMSYREGLEMNPYLDPAIRLRSSWKVIDLSASIDYRPTQDLRISPVFGYDITKDMPFFYNGYPTVEGINNAYGNVFSVKYMTSNRLKIGVNGLYTYRSLLTVLGEINYNQYMNFSETDAVDDLLKENGRKAWYKPGLEMRLRADITPADKFNFFFDYTLEALRYAPDASSFCKTMDAISDLNIGASYKLTKDVSAFLHLNNMLDQRYEVWNAYAVHGFTAVIGGSVNF